MGAEAGVDEGVLHRLRIEHRDLARRLARAGTPWRTDDPSPSCRRPDCPCRARSAASHTRPLLVEHRIVVVGAGVPELLVAPIGRRLQRLDARRHGPARATPACRIAHRHLEERHLVGLRIEDRHVVGRVFRRAVQRAVGVDRRIAPVGRDQVVQVFVRRRPFPRGDDDIALDALRPRRLVPSAVRPWRCGRSSRRNT